METDRTATRKFFDNFAIIFAIGLVILGMYTYRFYIRTNPVISLILFGTSTLSMFLILAIWRKFTEKYAPDIIYWTTQQKWLRKAVAGGSFSYYEYKDNIHKIGLFEPIARFLSMMIAFIGLASTFVNAVSVKPEPPVTDINSAIIWAIMIIIIPIILTPIVPIMWAMEDLQLKSWNEKYKTNIRISRKYKRRFNSIIAITTITAAYTLSADPSLTRLQNITNFLEILVIGIIFLTYPIAVLTLLYYIYFRGTVIEKIRDRMDIPMAETKLIYRNPKGDILDAEGEVIMENPETEKDLVLALANGSASPSQEELEGSEKVPSEPEDTSEEVEEEEEKNLPQKIGSGAKNAVQKTGDAVVGTGKAIVGGVASVGKTISDNTVGRLFGKDKSEEEEEEDEIDKTSSDDTPGKGEKPKYKYSGGSATAGLWDKEQDKKKKKEKK